MKTLSNLNQSENSIAAQSKKGFYPSFEYANTTATHKMADSKTGTADISPRPGSSSFSLLTDEAYTATMQGTILDMEKVCHDLYDTFHHQNAPYSAVQFIPVLKKINFNSQWMAEQFFKNPNTNHVLVQNDLLKVVLIHWKPGQQSSVHGHAQGGCVFKVLHGKLQEKRFSPDPVQELLALSTFKKGSMAYIDDEMAYHAVGNPFDEPAISLHVYTPGK